MKRGEVVQLPCLVGSLSSLRAADDLMMVKLLVPNNGTAAWVRKNHVTILRQPAAGRGELRALLQSTLVDEHGEYFMVEIVDRNAPRRIRIPEQWLSQELQDEAGPEAEGA